ncbi:MAG: hypothetical protein H7Y37_17680 [Anaerolineae bacterium]|nr:hypothetical protein [Gloeobacterales cyanobacterium ES-bin-313]
MYHPHCNIIEFHRMLSCLEEIGLVRPLIVRSSESEGLHVYYPLPILVSSYYLSKTAQHALESAGFKLSSGQLELFPNAKRYDPDGKTSFRAHRLPLLKGSYLLDSQTLEPYSNALPDFLSAWNLCSENQDSDQLITCIAQTKEREKAYRRSRYRGKRSSQGNLYDLSHLRWSGAGQTNDLLGYATWIGYAFQGLRTEEALSEWVVEWARNAPGYEEYCDHKYEIERRCRDWARSILSRSYKPRRREGKGSEGESDLTQPPKPLGMNNKERVESARSRIERAMAELIESGSLPIGVEARLFALQKLVGGSHGTYYRHRELWHPVDLAAAPAQQEEEECCFDRLEVPPTSEENPLDIIGRKSIESGLTDGVYEVMPQWKIDESQSKSSTLIPQLRPQITPQISPSMPKGRPRIDQRPPIPWPTWAKTTIQPKLKAISPNLVDQMPLNPVCYTLPMPMPIAVKVHLDGSRPWFKGGWLDGVRVLGSGRLPQTVEAFPFGLPSAKAKVP